ncbi:MAG: sodium:solute symporter [Ideonella sp.]|nr:sodium:solute symporter [Ideonella sp.]
MSAAVLFSVVALYFGLLLGVAWHTSRRADSQSFFIGNRRSHWALVAFGMVGTSLSGVTFISVPGAVGSSAFGYLQIVLGQVLGYAVIAYVLLPVYYRLQVTSIYGVLAQRLGEQAHRTGAGFFIASRTLGATARLYLVVRILQDTILDRLGLPFWATAAVIVVMIVLYTLEGGVKTIVWTDTLQTAGMLIGLLVCLQFLLGGLQLSPLQGLARLSEQGLATVFGTDPLGRGFWLKQMAAGAFIAIAMTGMDQEMMQKNISVTTLRDSQKNIMTLALVMVAVVAAFLFLGGLLQLFARQVGLDAQGDRLFPAVVMGHLPPWVQLVFIVALISALFPSADGALTALTASTCIDLLRMPERNDWDEARRHRIRRRVHLGFALLFMALVLVFRAVDNASMIGLILKLAGYTYGPLLGLFAFAVLNRRSVRGAWVPWVALASPMLCALIDFNQRALFGGYEIGLELLLLNGAITFAGLWAISRPAARHSAARDESIA